MSKQELFDEAMRLLDRVQFLLDGARHRHEKRVKVV